MRRLLVLWTACWALGGYAQDRPNILFLFSDDHAVKAISAYGGPLAKVAGSSSEKPEVTQIDVTREGKGGEASRRDDEIDVGNLARPPLGDRHRGRAPRSAPCAGRAPRAEAVLRRI